MASRIEGITVVIGGDVKGLDKALSGVNTHIRNTQSYLRDVERLLKLDPTNTELLQQKYRLLSQAVNETKNKLKTLHIAEAEAQEQLKQGKIRQEQYEGLKREIVATQQALEGLESKARDSKEALDGLANEAQDSKQALEQVAAATNKIEVASTKLSNTMGKVADKTKALSAASIGIMTGAEYAAIDFESAWAGVLKTVDGTEAELANIRQGIIDMAQETSSSSQEIAAVAEAAGQLGIATPDILDFTKTMVMLGDTTNISAQEAASALAKFANVVQMDADNYDKLGAAIVDLGNNFATTESDIVAMATRLASSGEIAGFSEAQILAVATAISSAGIEAEAGGSAFSKLTKKIQVAVETTSPALERYAKVAGMTVEEFSEAFEKDAVKAIGVFISGLNDTERNGQSAIAILEEMGMTEVRLSNTILSLANSGDLLTRTVETSNQAWRDNTALAEEAEKRYGTTASRVKQTKETVMEAAMVLGEQLMPYIQQLAEIVKTLAQRFADLSPEGQKTMVTILGIVAAIAPVAKMISVLSAAVGGVAGIFGTVSGAVAIFTGAATTGTAASTALAGAMTFITSTVIPAITTAVTGLFTLITGTVIPAITSALTGLFAFLMANPVVLVITAIVVAIVAFVALIVNKGDEIKAILQKVNDFLQGVFSKDWTEVFGPVLGNILNGFFANLKNIWDNVMVIFNGVIDFIRNVFSGNWEGAWSAVMDIFRGIFGMLVSIAKAPINGVIALLNGAIDGINSMIKSLNRIQVDIPDWVPGLGGKTFGINLPLMGKLAYLATGGVLSSGSAIVGEKGMELLTMVGGKAHVTPLPGSGPTSKGAVGGINITMNNTFNGYDRAGGEAAARDLMRTVDRVLGRAY